MMMDRGKSKQDVASLTAENKNLTRLLAQNAKEHQEQVNTKSLFSLFLSPSRWKQQAALQENLKSIYESNEALQMELEGFRKREQELSKREEEIKSREDKIRSTEELIIAQREELDRKIQEMDRVSEKGTKEDASLQMNVQEVPGKEEQISPRVQESSHHQPSASCGTPIDAQLNVVEHKELMQDASEPTPTESINGAQDIGESVALERKVILA